MFVEKTPHPLFNAESKDERGPEVKPVVRAITLCTIRSWPSPLSPPSSGGHS
jgi:hypothetical protein